MVRVDEATNELASKVIECARSVHAELGAGLLESAYETCLCYELEKENINYERQKELPIIYMGQALNTAGYKIDILIEDKIILEIKSVNQILPSHTAQIVTYLKLSKKHIGLLINFKNTNFQSSIRRIVL
ncbi:MAG: GxxExxY protein [Mediterranea sp.]|jgi:GxxExxY protein|nr:GxxExxY protein [Mediterranea sp.]